MRVEKLDNICNVITCGVAAKPQYFDNGVPFLSSLNVKENRIILDTYKFISKADHDKLTKYAKPQNGDILYTRVGSFGEAAVVNLDFEFSIFVSLTLIKPKKDLVDSRFLMWYLNSPKVRQFAKSNTSGIGVQNLNVSVVREYQIPLPSLSEQKKIAAILDAANELRQKDKVLVEKYNELTQALFLDMFGDPSTNLKKFPIDCLDAVCVKITDGEHGTVARLDSGKLYLMARNIRDNYIDLDEVSYISDLDHKKIYKRCNPEPGDLLLVCVGATIGRACITPIMDEFSLARSVALLKPDYNKVTSQYLYSFISSGYVQEVIKKSGNSSAQAGLYTGKIKELKIQLPPLDLQEQFSKRVKAIEEQKKIAQDSVKKSEELFNSLMQKAFNKF